MLVLSRKLGERIVIGDNIVLTLVRIEPDRVRIGIEAPNTTQIRREELLEDAERQRIMRHGQPEKNVER